jgi:hypothetical protein
LAFLDITSFDKLNPVGSFMDNKAASMERSSEALAGCPQSTSIVYGKQEVAVNFH